MTPERSHDALPEEPRPADAPPSGAPVAAAAPVGRRDLIKAGWAVPVALMVGTPLAVSGDEGSPNGPEMGTLSSGRPKTSNVGRNPNRVIQMALAHAIGSARQHLRTRTGNPPSVAEMPGTDGVSPLDEARIVAVVIFDESGSSRHTAVRGKFTGSSAEATKVEFIAKAEEAARDAWKDPSSPKGARLQAKFSEKRGADNQHVKAVRAAIGVVIGDGANAQGDTPTELKAAAGHAATRRQDISRKKKVHRTGFGGERSLGVISSTGGDMNDVGMKLVDVVAYSSSVEAEGLFAQHRGAIVWIDEDDEYEIVADFNGVRAWEIDIARGRASDALASALNNPPTTPPYGGLPLFDATHGAVGVYSQATSGDNSAGPIVAFCQEEYESNA